MYMCIYVCVLKTINVRKKENIKNYKGETPSNI